MPNVNLPREQAKAIFEFCKEHNQTQFFFAKDQGAYFGATTGSQGNGDFQNIIFYQKGMHPKLTEKENKGDWYDNARAFWGGDDFGIHIDVDDIKPFVEDSESGHHMVFQIN